MTVEYQNAEKRFDNRCNYFRKIDSRSKEAIFPLAFAGRLKGSM